MFASELQLALQLVFALLDKAQVLLAAHLSCSTETQDPPLPWVQEKGNLQQQRMGGENNTNVVIADHGVPPPFLRSRLMSTTARLFRHSSPLSAPLGNHQPAASGRHRLDA